MEALWKNIIYSIRMLSKRPSFSVLAVIAIALGIGANTTIFSSLIPYCCDRYHLIILNNS